jgi:hypothetical protein
MKDQEAIERGIRIRGAQKGARATMETRIALKYVVIATIVVLGEGVVSSTCRRFPRWTRSPAPSSWEPGRLSGTPTLIFFGWLSDIIGRKPVQTNSGSRSDRRIWSGRRSPLMHFIVLKSGRRTFQCVRCDDVEPWYGALGSFQVPSRQKCFRCSVLLLISLPCLTSIRFMTSSLVRDFPCSVPQPV